MSLKNSYITHLQTYITAEINNVATNEVIDSAFHDEFSYNNNADMNVTIKFLPGQIQAGIVQYPGEILIEVNEIYFATLLEALNNFTIERNESKITLDNKSYREYYSTPNVIGTFQNNGLKNCTAISISFSLILFNNVMGILPDEIAISINNGSTYESIPWLNYAFAYLSETNSTGAISSPQTRQIGETTGTNYTFTFVPRFSINSPQNNKVHQHIWFQIINGSDPNKKYVLKIHDYYPETPETSECIIPCVLHSGSITQQSNGLPIIQVTFVRGDF